MSDTATAVVPEPVAPLTHRRVLIVIGALMLGMFLAALDQTVVSTALPTIVGDLNGASHLSWVVTAYLLASTVSTPLWGKLGDLYGRKVFFQSAIVIFLIGSILSGLSQSMIELILFRAVQGLGGGGLMIGAQTIVGDVVSPRDRGRYMGLFMAMFGVTTVIGPLIGGFFVDYLSWRWIFYINIPIGAIALVVTASRPPPRLLSRVHRIIDYLGTALVALAATCLVLFTSLGGTSYPWTLPFIVGLAVAGVVFTVLFLWAERRAVEPVIPLAALCQQGVRRLQCHRLRGRLRHVRRTDISAPVLPGREGHQPHPVGGPALSDDGRAAGRLHRLRPVGQPMGPLQDLPGRRDGPHDGRAVPDVTDRREHRGVGDRRRTGRCSGSASGWSSRS